MNTKLATATVVCAFMLSLGSRTAAPNPPASDTTTDASGSMGATQPHVERRMLSPDDVRQVSPALERYTQERLYGEVWKRPDLSLRDRSIVTIAALIARGETAVLPY